MKKYLLVLLSLGLFASQAAAQPQKEVVIFSQPCHYCELMKKDLNAKIIPENPDIKFTVLDITESKNRSLLMTYIKQYKITGNEVGLPLLFIGPDYMMGWSDNSPRQIQEYIENLKQEKLSRFPVNKS